MTTTITPFHDLAASRHSVRKFNNQPIEREKLDLILEAGRIAPTACNYQPQRILVLESEEARTKLKECTAYHFDAPVALLVCYDKTKSWKRSFDGDDSGTIDGSIVTTQMMLQAFELGIGSTWVGFFDPKKVRNVFKLPNEYVPVALLPLGYPAGNSQPSPMHTKREPMENTVFYDAFAAK